MYRYLAIDSDGNVLLSTDSREDALKAFFGEFGEPAANEILVWTDGEYHKDEV